MSYLIESLLKRKNELSKKEYAKKEYDLIRGATEDEKKEYSKRISGLLRCENKHKE